MFYGICLAETEPDQNEVSQQFDLEDLADMDGVPTSMSDMPKQP